MRIGLLSGMVVWATMATVGAGDKLPAGIQIDREKKTVSIDAKVAPRKLEHLAEVYPIELIAGWAHPKGKKAHETVLTIDVNPSAVHQALESIGLKPGKPAKGDATVAEGPEMTVLIEVPQPGSPPKRYTLDKILLDPKTRKPFPKGVKFRFTGSIVSAVAPDKPEKVYGADTTGTLIAIFPVTDETVLQSSLTMKEEKYLKMDVNKELLPKEGEPVKLILEAGGK